MAAFLFFFQRIIKKDLTNKTSCLIFVLSINNQNQLEMNTRPQIINEGFKNSTPANLEYFGNQYTITDGVKGVSLFDKAIISAAKASKKHGCAYIVTKNAYNVNASPINKYYQMPRKVVVVFCEAGQMFWQFANIKSA